MTISLHADIYLYADDTTIVLSSKTWEELRALVNTVLLECNDWCYRNRLIVPVKNTVDIEFNFCNESWRSITSTNILGTIIDSVLKWRKHIYIIYNQETEPIVWPYKITQKQIKYKISIVSILRKLSLHCWFQYCWLGFS